VQDGHLGIQSLLPYNPFSYFKLKIILEDTTLIIPNFLILYVDFKDFYNEEYRMKNPVPNGINAIRIYCIDRQPTLTNDKPFHRRTDYDFAISQHQKLATIFDNLGFFRDVKADEKEKININENRYLLPCLEYKKWVKGDFEIKLWLEHSGDECWNNIHITPKDIL
jgi:hypothetical protein